VKEANARAYADDPEKERARVRARRAADPEAARARTRASVAAWRKKNPERAKAILDRYEAKNPEKVRRWDNEAHRRHRARKKNAPVVEHFSLKEIAVRDGWRCHLCAGRVTQENWSMDHLIPLSKGGDHTRVNVALAHRLCNSRRSSGVIPAQLRLVG
jgi:5-methylcytosine-specific restriction endonuclease McrA